MEIQGLPDFLIDMLKLQYGDKITSKIIEGYKEERVVSLRVNTLKSDMSKIQKVFSNNNISEIDKKRIYDSAENQGRKRKGTFACQECNNAY